MIEREYAFTRLAEAIRDQIVVAAIANQTASWYQAKHRPLNLYLRGPMGLAVSVGLGVALAHPQKEVVVIEGDGGLLMGLTALAAVTHRQPKNFKLICMDNGTYEAGGKGPTVSAGKVDFVQTVQGMGLHRSTTVSQAADFSTAIAEWLDCGECAFLHVCIGRRSGPMNAPKMKPFEMKYQFMSALTANRPMDP
jgi:thiamine pyrophosphate-dependent acetolactate synthase large subunit-like protein